jgi:hypothetical protein
VVEAGIIAQDIGAEKKAMTGQMLHHVSHNRRWRGSRHRSAVAYLSTLSEDDWRKPSLVVVALAPGLRGQPGRNAGDNDAMIMRLSGRSVRVLAFGLALEFSKPNDDTGMRSEEIPPVELLTAKTKKLTFYLPCCISIHCE